MSKKISFLLFTLSMLLCLALYWPGLEGTPIWDDLHFWFQDPVMQKSFSYLTIWKNFAWPMSVSLQKFILSLFEENYLYYHLLNLTLHFLNAFLVFKLAQRFKAKYAYFIYLLFLVHPSNVITVSWMVQFKTLLCFSFAIGSVLLFLQAKERPIFYLPSWLLYGASIFSKSASLPVFFIFLLVTGKDLKTKKALILIPFMLFTMWGSWRLLGSSTAQEAMKSVKLEQAVTSSQNKQTLPNPIAIRSENESTKLKSKVQKEKEKELPLSLSFTAKTLTYYFWQTILPIENAPVKGANFNPIGVIEIIHLGLLALMLFLSFKTPSFYYLLSGHLLLLPFMGLIPAPYMNITWVSDQHLYLVIPAFLLFWFSLLERMTFVQSYLIPIFFVVFFSYKTRLMTPHYQDEISFYEESLRYNPINVAISYNLASSYTREKRFNDAFNLINNIFYMGLNEPQIKNDPYFPRIIDLEMKLQKGFKP